jgi:bis(5'-nucleosyl)-tetraphosphatase (symmetrical)
VLRWVYAHRERVVSVLGNHDLHLLARAEGAPAKRLDTMEEVLEAPDAAELLDWLRTRPLLHREDGLVLVHAGFHPTWDLETTEALAADIGACLTQADGLEELWSRRKLKWRPGHRGLDRLAAALGVLTRIRIVRADGRAKLGFTGPPDDAPAGCRPWYEGSRLIEEGTEVLFGHWAMLGHCQLGRATCLDSGCCWGGRLTALRLDDRAVFHARLEDADRGPASRLWEEERA